MEFVTRMFRWLIYLLGECSIHLTMQPLCVDAQLRTLELWPGLALSDEEFVGEESFWWCQGGGFGPGW